MLDIKDKSCDEVFANFKSKWRYNIRLAMRKGVERVCVIFFCNQFYLLEYFSDGFTVVSVAYKASRCIKHCRVENRYFLYKHECTAVDFSVFVTNCNIFGNPTLFTLAQSAYCIKFPYLLFLQNSSYSLISIKKQAFRKCIYTIQKACF